MKCPYCNDNNIIKKGKTRTGKQRYLCRNCHKTFTEEKLRKNQNIDTNKNNKKEVPKIQYILTDEIITVFIDNKTFKIHKKIIGANKFYNIKEMLISNDHNVVKEITSIEKIINDNFRFEMDNFIIENGEVYLRAPLNNARTKFAYYNISENYFAKKIIKYLINGESDKLSILSRFFDNLLLNPDRRIIDRLGIFMEKGKIPITNRGTFVAYKRVRHDWKSIYDGETDHSIGSVVSLPRNIVDSDDRNVCSVGLHACSYDYLDKYIHSVDDRIVLVEINPKDVVSIPIDYNDTKLRCCRYVVIAEVTKEVKQKDILKNYDLYLLEK